MAEKSRSIVDIMKDKIKRSSSGLQNVFYVRKDSKVRIRFLTDMEEAVELRFHSKWQKYNHLCLSYLGKDCPHCDEEEEGGNAYDMYAFTIWNYESKKREVFMYKATRNSPIFQLISMNEEFGTITDRDYIIQKQGEGVNTIYTVVPIEKKQFRGEEQQFSRKKIIALVAAAFPYESDDLEDDSDEEEDSPPWKDQKKSNKQEKKSKKYEEEDDEEDFDEDEEEEEEPVKKKKQKQSSKKKYDEEDEDDDDE